MAEFQGFIDWFVDNIENWLLFFLIISTILTPTIIYAHQRSGIPRLKFGQFIKMEVSEMGTAGQIEKTNYFVEVINKNKRSEGKAKDCYGFITLGNKTFRTLWEHGHTGNTFGKQDLPLLFHIDKKDNSVNFSNYQRFQTFIETYDKGTNSNIRR